MMDETHSLHVLFRVADAEYVLPADDVLHMESFSSATRVPGTASYVAGLVQIRGRVIPVLDLRARFGLPSAPTTLDSRVVVVELGERTVGLLVDSAREVIAIEPTAFHPPPDTVTVQAGGFLKSIAAVGKRLVMLIDLPKVLGEVHAHGE
jgi:purine-binding chemotaxis protein CheW